MKEKVTKDFYTNVGIELSERGIYIKSEDIFILVKIILCCLFNTLIDKDKEVSVDRSVIIKRINDNTIKIRHNDRLFRVPGRLTMTDRVSNSIFQKIFLPILEEEHNNLDE